MSASEIAYRLDQGRKDLATRAGLDRRSKETTEFDTATRHWLWGNTQAAEDFARTEADNILAGTYPLLAMEVTGQQWPPDWLTDPRTGTRSPLRFGRGIDYRDETLVGDIKYIWELNRNLELPRLAQAYFASGDTRYLDGIIRAWQSWLGANPFPLGVNWASSLELGIRLINWAVTWCLIERRDPQALPASLKDSLIESIYSHQYYIDRHFSAHSSANNHLIGEAAGLYVASVTWPFWAESREWRARSLDIVERETRRQIAPDGVGREQTVDYLYFVLEFVLLVALASRSAADQMSAGFWERVSAGISFGRAMRSVSGHKPNIGDADDGCVLRLSNEDAVSYPQCVESLYLAATESGAPSTGTCARVSWFGAMHESGGVRAASAEMPGDEAGLPAAFDVGGYFLMGKDAGRAGEILCIVDCGPLGFLSIAAHGHADALSIILSIRGNRLLVDPGTYAYHTDSDWRDYFRGTGAHNTIRVDGQDQSLIGGNFMWLEHADATLEEFTSASGQQKFRGRHDGYERLDDPVTHRREILFEERTGAFQISDEIVGKSVHRIEQFWHLAPECRILEQQPGDILIESGDTRVRFVRQGLESHQQNIFFGSDSPKSGWYSDQFGLKVPTNTIRWSHDSDGFDRFTTQINVDP